MLYIDYMHRRRWLSADETDTAKPKIDRHFKETMLNVWREVIGIIHWNILPHGCIMTADLYYRQLD